MKTWFFLKLWKIGCTKLQKNPKKSKSHIFFLLSIVNWSGNILGQKKWPPSGVQCLLFLQFYLYFLIFDKKNLTHPKMTKNFFFAFFTLFHPQLEFFNYLQKQKSYSHQGRPDWQHFWVKPAISGARKALLRTKNQKSCFLFFICMGHKYNISDFQPNRWFCLCEVCHFIWNDP